MNKSNKKRAKNNKAKGIQNKWSVSYDRPLVEIIGKIGISNWVAIATNLKFRINKKMTADQCLNRWEELLNSVKTPSINHQLLIIAANYQFKHSWEDVFIYSQLKRREEQQFFLYFYSKFKNFAVNCSYQIPTIIKQFSNIDSLENLYFILIAKKILKNKCNTIVSKEIIGEYGIKLSDCNAFYRSILEKYGCKIDVKIKLNEMFKRTMETIWNKIQKEEPARDQTHESREGEEINYINLISQIQSLVNSNSNVGPHYHYNLMFQIPLNLPHYNRVQAHFYSLFPPNIFPNGIPQNNQNEQHDEQNLEPK